MKKVILILTITFLLYGCNQENITFKETKELTEENQEMIMNYEMKNNQQGWYIEDNKFILVPGSSIKSYAIKEIKKEKEEIYIELRLKELNEEGIKGFNITIYDIEADLSKIKEVKLNEEILEKK